MVVKQILELLMVIIIGALPLGNTAKSLPQQPVSVTASLLSQQSDEVKFARFENMLNHNYCFGSDFENDGALLFGACLSFADKIEDGKIEKALVDAFVKNMYGVSLSENGEDGFYTVPACGYDTYRHTVTGFDYNGDGTVTVRSLVAVNPDVSSEVYDCESVFFANGESAFGYNLIFCNVAW